MSVSSCFSCDENVSLKPCINVYSTVFHLFHYILGDKFRTRKFAGQQTHHEMMMFGPQTDLLSHSSLHSEHPPPPSQARHEALKSGPFIDNGVGG